MKWVSYTRSISSRIGEENPSNTIAEQNERIAQYLKKRGCSVSEKYSDRKRTAEAAEGFDRLVQDGKLLIDSSDNAIKIQLWNTKAAAWATVSMLIHLIWISTAVAN